MITFKIAHLYYDLMNLYGENGNVRYLKNRRYKRFIYILWIRSRKIFTSK